MRKDDHLIFEALQNRTFTIVSGGTDNGAEHGFDTNLPEYIQAADLKSAVQQMIANMAADPDVEPENIDQTFPKEFREFREDHFVMSNDNGDWYYVFPGKLNEQQAYDRVLATGDYGSEDSEEDVPYASGQVGGRGEEYGSGEVKLLLLRDEKFDCYLNGTVQSVSFFKGTTFNCEPFDGEFYNCESDEYGTIAITPDAHLKILDAPAGSTNTEDEDAESADERKERTQRKWEMNKNRWAKWKMENPEAAAKHAAKKAGKSENAEDSAEDKMRDRENARDEKQRDTEVSPAFHYNPMPGLMKAASEIRDILHGAANDEARTEHIIKMAQTILGDPTEYDKNEYRKMLDGLIVLLNRFIVVPMN